MPCCYALTKQQKRCRGLAPLHSNVCKRHTSFFASYKIQERLIEHLEYKPGLCIFYRESIRRQLLCVKECIMGLSDERRFTYFYLICANNYKGFSSSWNRELHKEAYKMVWERMNSIGPIFITYRHLYALVKLEPVKEFYEMLKMFPYGRHALHEPWIKFFDRMAKIDFFEPMFHVDEEIHRTNIRQVLEVLDKNPFTQSYVLRTILESGLFMRWLQAKKRCRYDALQKRISPFWNELMEVAWEPSRVVWCMDESQKQEWS